MNRRGLLFLVVLASCCSSRAVVGSPGGSSSSDVSYSSKKSPSSSPDSDDPPDPAKPSTSSLLQGAISGYFEKELGITKEQAVRAKEEVQSSLSESIRQVKKGVQDLKQNLLDPEVQGFLDQYFGSKGLTIPLEQLKTVLDKNPRLLRAFKKSGVEGRLRSAAASTLEKNLSPKVRRALSVAQDVSVEVALDIIDRNKGKKMEQIMDEMVRFSEQADRIVDHIIESRAMSYFIPEEYLGIVIGLVKNKTILRVLLPTFAAVLVGLDPREPLLSALIVCFATMNLTREKALGLLEFLDEVFLEGSIGEGGKSGLKKLMEASSANAKSIGGESLAFFREIAPYFRTKDAAEVVVVARKAELTYDCIVVLRMIRLMGLIMPPGKSSWRNLGILRGGRWTISLDDTAALDKYLRLGRRAGVRIQREDE